MIYLYKLYENLCCQRISLENKQIGSKVILNPSEYSVRAAVDTFQ